MVNNSGVFISFLQHCISEKKGVQCQGQLKRFGMLRKFTGGGGSVSLGQNQNYEAAVYKDEEVYEVPK